MYLTRGLAMYYSLEKQCKDFHLYVFAFDSHSFQILTAMKLEKATIISLKSFENEALLAIKSERTVGEYCWTCTPATIIYCIDTYKLASCTYIDADLFFFSDPAILFEEMPSEKSVIITEHRYTPKYDQSATSGKYCVQFVYFKNDERGRKVLDWWNDACLEWCYNRFEDNKFGDQKYLDDWCTRFEGVHELENLGGGVAPWNVQQYSFVIDDEGGVKGRVNDTREVFDVVFYHFHGMKYCEMNTFLLDYYEFSPSALKNFYKPYVKALKYAENLLSSFPSVELSHENEKIPRIRKSLRRMFRLYVMGQLNNYYTFKYLTK